MVVITDFKNMFWGVTIGGGKRYSQMVERSFHISMAALEPSSAKGCVSVMIQHEKAEFLLCSLDSKTLFQQSLDLNFTEGEEVTFFLNGTGVVHLTGFLLEEEEEGEDSQFGPLSDSEEEEDMESSDEDAPELIPAKSKDIKRKLENKFSDSSSAKKKKQGQLFQEMDLDESDDSEDEDYNAKFIDDEAEEDSDAEDSEDDIPEDEFSEEEEEKPVLSSKKAKKLAKQEAKNKTEDKTPKKKDNKENLSKTTPAGNQSLTKTPSSEKPMASEGETTEGKKKKRKKKKKKKGGEDNANVNGGAATPKSETKTPVKRVVGGGVIVEDLQAGHGPEAKSGKMVHVYYNGKLTNGKPFDSCSSGKPFGFRLGKGEVIKGWDNGLAGMKVGGKRKITVPPQQGYGSQRQGPIPPNSTLIFDVELKAVS